MKKIIIAVLCFMLTLSFVACGTIHEQKENNPVSNNSESKPNVNQPVSDVLETHAEKELLKIQFFPIFESEQLENLEEEQAKPTVEHVDIAYSNLVEMDGNRYAGNPELQVFSDYIKQNFSIVLDNNWKVYAHYYDMDKSVGMVKFQYFIGEDEIGTNKCIVFNLNNGKADMIFHTCLDGIADEKALQDRVSSFKTKYEQEKYQLKAGEVFETEITYYSFNYNTGDLSYCYNIFFSYDDGIINNEYGTECFIDQDGNAILKFY